ncbi:hypothetical protein FBEOM_10237 [Fusarium beomiforme]|uniref:Uncharacterized protein n=1 Tax=Fusarium beomiforme TaxID=44412 RepID=A0A9P5DVM4_9HYPO|nr:hypothetical protein FBEOM_10237 [Fusarium beomiforme]
MIRQKWLPIARAIFAAQTRSIHSPSTRFPNFAGNNESGTSMKDKIRTSLPNANAKSKPKSATRLENATTGDEDNRHMLVIKGLPTNLRAADFHRLAPGSLSGWSNIITHVHQERDPWTMEPLGNYYITFPSNAAVYLYRDKVQRLLRLAQAKMKDTTGLWATKVNPILVDSKIKPEVEVERFTLLPGSYGDNPEMERKRTRKMAWHVMLFELPQTTFSASELKAIIKQDGIECGHNWRIDVFSLRETMDFEKDVTRNTLRVPLVRGSPVFRHQLDSRFVLTCESPERAWRFIRNWNQRILEYDGGDEVILRNRVKVSYIEI